MGDHRVNPFAHGTSVVRPPQVRDSFGRVLSLGDLLLMNTTNVTGWRLTRITPALDVNAPPNSLHVRLVAAVELLLPADAPIRDLVRLATAEEQGLVAEASENGAGGPTLVRAE